MAGPENGTGNDLVVNDEVIAHFSGRIDTVIGQLQANRGQLETAASETRAGWSGEAAAEFSRGAGEANVNLDRLIKALGNLNDLLRMSKDGFVAEEQEQAAQLRAALAGGQVNPDIINS